MYHWFWSLWYQNITLPGLLILQAHTHHLLLIYLLSFTVTFSGFSWPWEVCASVTKSSRFWMPTVPGNVRVALRQLEAEALKCWITEVTCGGSRRWCQAWMRLSMMPSPNNPASTVSVTTKDTLRKTQKQTHEYKCQISSNGDVESVRSNPHCTCVGCPWELPSPGISCEGSWCCLPSHWQSPPHRQVRTWSSTARRRTPQQPRPS